MQRILFSLIMLATFFCQPTPMLKYPGKFITRAFYIVRMNNRCRWQLQTHFQPL